MRAVAGVIAGADTGQIAVANAQAVLREKLGWSSESEARTDVLTQFTSVVAAAFASLASPEAESEDADVERTLAEFERWYAATHPQPFWALFETFMPETPRVDF
jgi:hypothetical protein